MFDRNFLSRAAATSGAVTVGLAALTGLSAAQLAMAPHPTPSHAATSTRPVWDGFGTYSAGVMPLCPARDAGNGALLADGTEVECVVDGDGLHGPVYVWSVTR